MLYVRKLKRAFQEMSRQDIEEHHDERIKEMMIYVKEHSPYYRKALRGSPVPTVADLPPIDKAFMMENFNEINTVGLTKHDYSR